MKTSCRKIIRNVVLFFSLLFVLLNVQAQKAESPLPETTWHIQELSSATGNHSSPNSFKKSILYLNNEAVCAVQFNKEEWGVVKINSHGKELWNFKVKSPLVGLAKFGDNIVFFHAEVGKVMKVGSWGFTKELHGVLLNGKDGSLIKTRLVFDNADWAYFDYRVFTQPGGEFSNLAVRVSNSVNERTGIDKRYRLTSAKLLLLQLNADLSVTKTIDIPAIGKEGLFQGIQAGKNNDVFFCSLIDDQLTVEHFDQFGKAIGKLAAPLSVRQHDMILEPITTADAFAPSTMFVGLYYKNKDKDFANQVFEFDFSNNKVVGTGEEELTKNFRKSLVPSKIKELKKGDLDYIDKLNVIDVVSTGEKIAVIREIQFEEGSSVSSGFWFRAENLLVSIYDRQWKLIKTITLDKRHLYNKTIGRSIGINIEGENLRLIMSAMDGNATHAIAYAIVDLAKQELKEFKTVDKYRVSKDHTLEGGASLWFPDGVLVEHLIPKGGAFNQNRNFYSVWQKIVW